MISKVKGIEYNPPRTTGQTAGYGASTSERVVNSLLIPAGSFKQYDLFGIDSRLIKSGTNGTVTVRIRIATSVAGGLTGALVGTYTSTATTHTLIPIMRRLSIQNLTNSTVVLTNTTSASGDFAGPSVGFSTVTTIDWSVDQYVIITSQTASSIDTVYCPYIITDFIQGA